MGGQDGTHDTNDAARIETDFKAARVPRKQNKEKKNESHVCHLMLSVARGIINASSLMNAWHTSLCRCHHLFLFLNYVSLSSKDQHYPIFRHCSPLTCNSGRFPENVSYHSIGGKRLCTRTLPRHSALLQYVDGCLVISFLRCWFFVFCTGSSFGTVFPSKLTKRPEVQNAIVSGRCSVPGLARETATKRPGCRMSYNCLSYNLIF